MRDGSHDSNDASKKSFGHKLTVGAILLAGVMGLVKHADNIFRPLLKGGDDAANVFIRNSDELARYSNNGIDSSAYTAVHPYLIVKGAQTAVRGAQSAAKDDDKLVVSGQRNSTVEAPPFMQLTMSMSDLKETYTIEDDGYYHMSATFSVNRTEDRRNGTLLTAESIVETELPNRQKGEYEQLKLIRADGSTYLREEVRYMLEDKAISFFVEADVEFVQGNWEQYVAGKSVTLQYTSKGLKEIASQLEKQTRQQFTSILAEQFGQAVQVRIDITHNPNQIITIDPKQIEILASGVFKMKVSVNILINRHISSQTGA